MEARVCKVTESGKSMLVGIKKSKYQQGFIFGWASNPDAVKAGDVLEDFHPSGREAMTNEAGPVLHSDGSPVMKWVF